jgi:hypothetical protein
MERCGIYDTLGFIKLRGSCITKKADHGLSFLRSCMVCSSKFTEFGGYTGSSLKEARNAVEVTLFSTCFLHRDMEHSGKE